MKIIAIVVLFVVHFVFGIMMRGSVAPYNTAILTIHKLSSVAALILIGLVVWQGSQSGDMSALAWLSAAILLVVFIGVIATGGILSARADANAIITMVHNYAPYAVLVLTIVILVLLPARGA